MNPSIVAVFIPIVAIGGGIIMVILMMKYHYTERMAMIERGMNPGSAKPKTKPAPSVTLRFALVTIGAGLGLLAGELIDRQFDMPGPVAYFSMILLFGGSGLLLAYIIQLRQDEREKREKEREIV